MTVCQKVPKSDLSRINQTKPNLSIFFQLNVILYEQKCYLLFLSLNTFIFEILYSLKSCQIFETLSKYNVFLWLLMLIFGHHQRKIPYLLNILMYFQIPTFPKWSFGPEREEVNFAVKYKWENRLRRWYWWFWSVTRMAKSCNFQKDYVKHAREVHTYLFLFRYSGSRTTYTTWRRINICDMDIKA